MTTTLVHQESPLGTYTNTPRRAVLDDDHMPSVPPMMTATRLGNAVVRRGERSRCFAVRNPPAPRTSTERVGRFFHPLAPAASTVQVVASDLCTQPCALHRPLQYWQTAATMRMRWFDARGPRENDRVRPHPRRDASPRQAAQPRRTCVTCRCPAGMSFGADVRTVRLAPCLASHTLGMTIEWWL